MIEAKTTSEKWALVVHACLRGGLATTSENDFPLRRDRDHWGELRMNAVFRNWARSRSRNARRPRRVA